MILLPPALESKKQKLRSHTQLVRIRIQIRLYTMDFLSPVIALLFYQERFTNDWRCSTNHLDLMNSMLSLLCTLLSVSPQNSLLQYTMEKSLWKEDRSRKERIKKGLDKKNQKKEPDGMGSTPAKTREEEPSHPSPVSNPCQHCLLRASSTLHLHFPPQWMSVFIPVMPEEVPKIHRESLVTWYLELAPEQKLL